MVLQKKEFSSGAVVFWKNKFLLGKHSGYHKWVLPKGLIETGEKEIETAVREIDELLNAKDIIAKETAYLNEVFDIK